LIVNLQHTNAVLQQKYDIVRSHLIRYRQKNNVLEQQLDQKQTFIETESNKQQEISVFLKSKIDQLQKTANYEFHEQCYAVERKQWEARIQELEEQIIGLRSDLIRQQIDERERTEVLMKNLDAKLKDGQERERAQVDCYMTMALHFEEEWKRACIVISTYDKEKLGPVIQERDKLQQQVEKLEKTVEAKNKKMKQYARDKKKLNQRIAILDTKVTLLMEKLGNKDAMLPDKIQTDESGTSGGEDSDADVVSKDVTRANSSVGISRNHTPFREPDVSKKGGLNDHAKITKYGKKLRKNNSRKLIAGVAEEGDLDNAVYNERTNALENLDSGVQTFLPIDMKKSNSTAGSRSVSTLIKSRPRKGNNEEVTSVSTMGTPSASTPQEEPRELKKLGVFDRFRKFDSPLADQDRVPEREEDFNGSMIDTHEELMDYADHLVEMRKQKSTNTLLSSGDKVVISDSEFADESDNEDERFGRKVVTADTPLDKKPQSPIRSKRSNSMNSKSTDPLNILVAKKTNEQENNTGQQEHNQSDFEDSQLNISTHNVEEAKDTSRSDISADAEEEAVSPTLEAFRISASLDVGQDQPGLRLKYLTKSTTEQQKENRLANAEQFIANESIQSNDSKLFIPDYLREQEEQHQQRSEEKIQHVTKKIEHKPKIVTTMVITSYSQSPKEIPVHKKVIVAATEKEPERHTPKAETPDRSYTSIDFTRHSKPNYFLYDKKKGGLHPEVITFNRFDDLKKKRTGQDKLPKLGSKSANYL
jgi:hypothetical protein